MKTPVVAGCVPEYQGRILLCRRATTSPRLLTVPAGFMELGESLTEAVAVRDPRGGARRGRP